MADRGTSLGMGGIAGIVTCGMTAPVTRERLLGMSATLRHRGPDDEGFYLDSAAGLVVRRLAVSDVLGGRQPVCDETGAIQAACNGEIYNHRHLRDDLIRRGHRLVSTGDCEVIPHLYEEYGLDFPQRLEGTFAIAVWDRARQRLILARDRLGIKPLYYAVETGRLVFGSELKTLLAAGVKTSVDAQSLSDYLSLLYIPSPGSIYAEIRSLEPASLLIWQAGKWAVRRYWTLADQIELAPTVTPRRARRTLRALLADSVAERLVADVPVGFFLNSGLASSAVVATARQVGTRPRLPTFTVGFPGHCLEERADAAAVAHHVGAEHAELLVRPQVKDIVDGLLPAFDQPFADPAMVPTYYLARYARERVTVALSGDGGDELFAYHLACQVDRIVRSWRRLPWVVTARAIPALQRFLPASSQRLSVEESTARQLVEGVLADPVQGPLLRRVLQREQQMVRLLQPDLLAGLADAATRLEPHYPASDGADVLRRLHDTDVLGYLSDNLLVRLDRAAMAHSLEARLPLLATPIVEFVFSLPHRLKTLGLRPHRLLSEALAPALPRPVAAEPTRDVTMLLGRWLRRELRPLVDEYLSREVLDRQGYLRPEEVSRLVARHMSGKAEYGRQLWSVLVLSLWAEQQRMYR